MNDDNYIPPRGQKKFTTNIPHYEYVKKNQARQPLLWKEASPAGGQECNDGEDGQDGAQTDCSGDCHAYFA